MSTNARIGIELKDGSILSAYHHWDGYPQWLGKTLKEHFNTRDDVAELIDGGDMSVCWTDDTWRDTDGKMGKKDSYGPQYYSERGDRDVEPILNSNLIEYLEEDSVGYIEYVYVFNQFNEWICYDLAGDTATLTEIPD
tara:strand:+ start:16 stop:429 length:414 start_codon:yes stop_codon:yes gene_type:complete